MIICRCCVVCKTKPQTIFHLGYCRQDATISFKFWKFFILIWSQNHERQMIFLDIVYFVLENINCNYNNIYWSDTLRMNRMKCYQFPSFPMSPASHSPVQSSKYAHGLCFSVSFVVWLPSIFTHIFVYSGTSESTLEMICEIAWSLHSLRPSDAYMRQ